MISSKRRIKTLSGLFLGIVFIFIGNSLVLSSAGVIFKSMGVGELMTGAVNSCFYLGAIASTIFTSFIVSSYGHIRSYAILTSCFALTSIMHDMSSNLIYWAFLRFLLGFCYYGLVMIVESWINAKSRNEIRSRVIAFYEIIYYVSFAIGTTILALNLAPIKIFILSAFFIIMGSIPLNIIRVNPPAIPVKHKISIPNIFKLAPLALVASFVAGILVNGFLSMASLYVLNCGYEVKYVSVFMGIAMVGGFVSHTFFGIFSDKFGRKYSIMLSSLIGITASILLLIFDSSFILKSILVFFLGVGIFCLYSLALARANDVVQDKNKTIKVAAALLLSYSIGSFFAPLIMGGMMKFLGDKGFVLVYLFCLVALFIFTIFQKVVPKDQRAQYKPIHASPVLKNN